MTNEGRKQLKFKNGFLIQNWFCFKTTLPLIEKFKNKLALFNPNDHAKKIFVVSDES